MKSFDRQQVNSQAEKIATKQSNALFSLVVPRETAISNGGIKADPFDPSKRKGYLSWDDYFMAIAFLSAHRSKDPNRQVGACLVSQDRVILGIGYNGFPRGCSDDLLPWAKMSFNGDPLQTKYPYVCHAEVNAILNKNQASACGQRLYVTMFPCNECAKIIIQAGVAEVIYFIDKNHSSADYSYIASQKLLSMAGVKCFLASRMKSRHLDLCVATLNWELDLTLTGAIQDDSASDFLSVMAGNL